MIDLVLVLTKLPEGRNTSIANDALFHAINGGGLWNFCEVVERYWLQISNGCQYLGRK